MSAPVTYAARWVLPVATPPIPDGAVAVDAGGRIAYVGPRAGAPALGPVEELGDAVVLPGFVDAHAHLGLDAYAGVRTRLAAGVTTIADTAPDGAAVADALVALGARGVVYQDFVGPDPSDRAAALAVLRARITELRARALGAASRVRVGVSPRAAHAVHEDLLLDACAWAVGENLPIAMRMSETPAEVAFLRDAAGPYADAQRARGLAVARRAHSAVHLLAELGIAAVARPLLVHGTEFDASDVALAAHYDCPVVVCPAADAALGRGSAPVRALLDANVRTALGAWPIAAAADLTPVELLHLATIGGAAALDMAHEVGALELGKYADLAAFPLATAAADPVATAVAALAGGPALLTVVAGRVVARHTR